MERNERNHGAWWAKDFFWLVENPLFLKIANGETSSPDYS